MNPFKFLIKPFSLGAPKEQPKEEPEEPELEPKDPMDWTLGPNSTTWESDSYCPHCKSSTCHTEKMTDICNSCGTFGDMMKRRARRKIWDGENWMLQYKYGNGAAQYTIQKL